MSASSYLEMSTNNVFGRFYTHEGTIPARTKWTGSTVTISKGTGPVSSRINICKQPPMRKVEEY